MKTFKNLALAGLLALTSVGVCAADDGYIVRTSDINAFTRQFGGVAKDISQGHGVYLVRLPNSPLMTRGLKGHPLVQNAETNGKVMLPETVSGAATQLPKQWARLNGVLRNGSKVTAPSQTLYMNQPAIGLIKLPQDALKWYGQGVTVAVIDTWVDASNTVLGPSINKSLAYDTIANQPGGASISQETSPFIDQETSPFIDSTGTILFVNQETSPFIDQETSPFIDQETSPFIDGIAWAHGTMVAGLVHRVAPAATIVPIRAFTDDGGGAMADVIQGIYYAVNVAKVQVINMSFSAPVDSAELRAAIKYAQEKGVTCVASVSNSKSSALVYPAAEEGVIGVAATDYNDYKADFSDYGQDVNLAAPGVEITSTAPANLWGLSSGTSFATPMVTGAVAVMKSLNWSGVDPENAAEDLDHAADKIKDPVYAKQLGAGRLDVAGSAHQARNDK